MVRRTWIDVPGGRVAAWIGEWSTGLPVLALHGGLGRFTHDSLRPLQGIGHAVVLWDQLGCGASAVPPPDPAVYSLERSVAEVEAVRAAIGAPRVHVFGHGIGGWIALEHALAHPDAVAGLVLASTSASRASLRHWLEDAWQDLPEPHARALYRGNAADPDWPDAVAAFTRRHGVRSGGAVQTLEHVFRPVEEAAPYRAMVSDQDFSAHGPLRFWDRRDALADVRSPTLVTCGRWDMFPPHCSTELVTGLPDAELHVFEQSAHVPHVEQRNAYLRVLEDFLTEAD